MDCRGDECTRPGSWRRCVPFYDLPFDTQLNLGTSGIIEVGSVYYWIGEDHTNGGAFQAINCYSSRVSRHVFDLTV
jgi:hypothetical protein